MPAKQYSGGNGADPRRAQPGSREARHAGRSPRTGKPQESRKEEAWKAAELGLPEAEDRASVSEHVADAGDAVGWTPSTSDEEAARADPPQPRPRDYGETIRTAVKYVPGHEPRGDQATAESDAQQGDDGTGGEMWNRVLGGNTNAGMIRFLGAIALFILIFASLFWLFAD
ncbi:hypothetical protein ILFOPFJJ_03343 [Ensifer psoraleae]|uniref:hypothetical protein n=1 Tax=Sinorhizobium psoraleae TaxID=520838 RepID=UPI001FE3EE79|nr:hypothetical protein [Sinorhizobium psoraleae]NRP72445.1 hypothetical protein [Sinorhizobium psoraleae]